MNDLPLPQWAYVPGEAYEPDADYERRVDQPHDDRQEQRQHGRLANR